MFLATTALSEFWDKKQEILFLGSWCCRYDRLVDWQGLRFQMMPSPWNDRRRFYQAAHYLDDVGERVLGQLTDYLNDIHQLSYGTRYWRILVGPWLFRYLHSLYDRYILLEEAFRKYPNLETILLAPESFRVPWDTRELINLYTDDLYNLQMFSQLLVGMGYRFPERSIPSRYDQVDGAAAIGQIPVGVKQWLQGGLDYAWEAISGFLWGRCPVVLYHMYCPRVVLWRLILKTRFRALPLALKRKWLGALRVSPTFDERRQGLGRFSYSSEFERLFVMLLPQSFPILYLEGFQAVRRELLKRYRGTPRVLVSVLRWYTDEAFKFFAGEAGEKGTRLVTVDHGGGSGFMRFHPEKLHEERVGNPFVACGWVDETNGKSRNLPSVYSSPLFNLLSHRSKATQLRTILFVTTLEPRYLHKFHSCPVGSQWEEYLAWQLRFLAAVPPQLRANILYRPYMKDYGFAIREQFLKRFGDIGWDDSVRVTFRKRLRDARLAVVDYAGSTYVEVLAANVPTVLYWNFQRWEAPQDAESYFDALRTAGIFWDTPEAAAQKVAEVYEEPWKWWGSAFVQEARLRFLDRFALAREDWADQWARVLKDISALSRKEKREPAHASQVFATVKS